MPLVACLRVALVSHACQAPCERTPRLRVLRCKPGLGCDRYNWDLFLLSIDEGISGYRDDSLETVKRNEQQVSLLSVDGSTVNRKPAVCSHG